MIKRLFALVGLFIPLVYMVIGALSFFKPQLTYLMLPIYSVVSIFLLYWAFGNKVQHKIVSLIGVIASFSFLGFFISVLSDYTLFTVKERLELLWIIFIGSLLAALFFLGVARLIYQTKSRTRV